MKMNSVLAIDPGASGGIAWRESSGKIFVQRMSDTLADLKRLLQITRCTFVVVEKTGGYMPGNSGPASVKFARHCGEIDGLLVGLGISFERVSPQVWQKHLGALPKEKPDRKRKIKALMQERYPDLNVTLCTADALGILTWKLKDERLSRNAKEDLDCEL